MSGGVNSIGSTVSSCYQSLEPTCLGVFLHAHSTTARGYVVIPSTSASARAVQRLFYLLSSYSTKGTNLPILYTGLPCRSSYVRCCTCRCLLTFNNNPRMSTNPNTTSTFAAHRFTYYSLLLLLALQNRQHDWVWRRVVQPLRICVVNWTGTRHVLALRQL